MSNLWDDDQNTDEFRDMPDEAQLDANGQTRQSPPVQVRVTPRPAQPQPQPQPIVEDMTDDEFELSVEEEDFTEVLSDANLRIEQGRLYQMIMNHDLFEGMDADPKAVQNVQKEIRKFARESMEVMLGMRQTTPAYAGESVASPFNYLEIDILKKLASTASKGATENVEEDEVPEPVRPVPKRQTLNTISAGARRPAPKPQAKAQPRLPSKPTAPIKRTKLDATIDQICAEEGIPRSALEEHYRPLGKPAEELSETELASRAKETARRLASRKTVKSDSALPMASAEQQELLAIQRASQIGSAPGMAALLERVKTMPIKN